jgi:hypothetical protein
MNAATCIRYVEFSVAVTLLLGAGGCTVVEPSAEIRQLDELAAGQTGQTFRSKPYLEMAALLQAMPQKEAVDQLRRWAHSGKYETQVIVLCRMLFEDKDGGPLKLAPSQELFDNDHAMPQTSDHGLEGIGATRGSDWPDWPIAIVNGVPFLIEAKYNGVVSGPWSPKPPPPFSPVYLDYCLREGRWTSHRYALADFAARQKALDALLQPGNWHRGFLFGDEIKHLTYQIADEPSQNEPPMPTYVGTGP